MGSAFTLAHLGLLEASGPFGGTHLLLLGLAGVLGVAVVWGLRRIRGTRAETLTLQLAGWTLLVASAFYVVWYTTPERWVLSESLPLHYSDILRFLTGVALITRRWWAIAIAYLWGLTLNVQAMVTPHHTMLDHASVITVFYWVLHMAVLLAAVGLIWGCGHRVDWRGFGVAYGTALAWAAVLVPLNAALGTNYGFVNEPPDGASLIDLLGRWPTYLVWLVLLVGAVWALMTWPSVRGGRSWNAGDGPRTPQTQKTPRPGARGSSLNL